MTPPLVADLHVHYPMHVLADDREAALKRMVTVRGRPGAVAKVRGAVLWVTSRLLNYSKWDGGPRVTVDFLAQGGVRVALSVLYSPFDEMDLDEPYGAAPEPDYFRRLVEQLETIEDELAGHERAAVVRRATELDRALSEEKVAIVHCVEGGFHLGATPEQVDASVTALAARGVAYITLAHLFWRRVAANAPAIPFLPDALYDGVRKRKTKTLEESVGVIARHVDRIHDITGTHRHVAIGSDFDGFIKPTLGGLERSSDLERLSAALISRYGAADAERILAGNALRVLRSALR